MRWTRLVIALGVAAAISAAPAQADPTIEFSVSPERVAPGDPITYKVTIKTGAEAERFGLSVGPRPVDQADGRPRWPLVKSAEIAYDGPGTAQYSYVTPAAALGCSVLGFRPTRGAVHEGSVTVWLELPAGTTSTLTFTGDTAYAALIPRIGEVYGLGFRTRNDDWDGRTGGTLDAPGTLPAPVTQPANGPRGVWLSLAPEPPSVAIEYWPCPAFPVVREPIVVRGRTDPALPGHTVLIEGGDRASKTRQIFGSAVVGGDGTFTFGPWTPPATGDYELRAIYRSQSPDFVDDVMEGAHAFRYEAPAPPAVLAPPVSSAVALASRATVRRGIARVRMACPKTATTRCRGRLRLRRDSTTWGRGTFSVAPGKAHTLRLRLSRAARAVLARRRSVRVQVDLMQQGAAPRTLPLSLRR
jgi:hypothetical protein